MIILASKSASRKAMLDAAGVAYQSIPADIDERAVELAMTNLSPPDIAEGLAVAKAEAVAGEEASQLVLGSDSLVVVDGRRFDKPASRANAIEHLRFFSGKVIELHSGAALSRRGKAIWQASDTAKLYVRDLSDDFIAHYLNAEWPAVSYCVGVFRIEAMGVQLFNRIEGDQFTVLGMPLLPVLGALREHGELPS